MGRSVLFWSVYDFKFFFFVLQYDESRVRVSNDVNGRNRSVVLREHVNYMSGDTMMMFVCLVVVAQCLLCSCRILQNQISEIAVDTIIVDVEGRRVE